VKRFSSSARGLRIGLLLKRFGVSYHILRDGWNKTMLSTGSGICFTVLYKFYFNRACAIRKSFLYGNVRRSWRRKNK